VNSNWKKKVDDIRKTALQLGSSHAHDSVKLQNEVEKQVILSDPLEVNDIRNAILTAKTYGSLSQENVSEQLFRA